MPAASGGGGGALAAAGSPSTKVIDAHLAVQATIRSYQVRERNSGLTSFCIQLFNFRLDRFAAISQPRSTLST